MQTNNAYIVRFGVYLPQWFLSQSQTPPTYSNDFPS